MHYLFVAIAVVISMFGDLAGGTLYTGRILVASPNPQIAPYGYVRNRNDSVFGMAINGIYYAAPDTELYVKIQSSGTVPVNLVATNPSFLPPFNIGFRGHSANSSTIAKGSFSTLDFLPVEPTNPNAPPDSSTYSESAVWTLNTTTKQLIPQWINLDGSRPNTVIALDLHYNKIFVTGDIDYYNQANYYYPASLVTFQLVN